MRFVKSILGEILHFGKDLLCRIFVDPPVYAAVDNSLSVFLQPVNEIMPLHLHRFHLFLADNAAQYIRLPQRIPGQTAHYLHDLLLVDHAAIGNSQYRL